MKLATVSTLTKPADPAVVKYIEGVLDRAKSGEVDGVLILAQDSTGLSYSVAGILDRYTVTGWLTHAIYKLQSDGG